MANQFGRYEKHDNSLNQHKYYELALMPDNSVTVTWGRIGSKGSSQRISRTEASDRIQKKQRDGYQFVSSTLQNSPVVVSSLTQDITKPPVQRDPEQKTKKEEFSISDWITK